MLGFISSVVQGVIKKKRGWGGGSVLEVGSHDGTVGITESGRLTVSGCS